MKLSFKKNGVVNEPLIHWSLDDDNIVVIYQGSRGGNPELDYIIKYKSPGKRLRAPSHTHWIVDLIVKSQFSDGRVCSFISEWIELYDKIEPFKTQEERNTYQLIYTEYFKEEYFDLDNLSSFSVEFLSVLMELFIKCEKQTLNAFMFKNLLKLMKDYCDGTKDFYQVISYSKRV
jgi:hypothetical protein